MDMNARRAHWHVIATFRCLCPCCTQHKSRCMACHYSLSLSMLYTTEVLKLKYGSLELFTEITAPLNCA